MISIRPPRPDFFARFVRTAAAIALMLPLAGCDDYEFWLGIFFAPFACAAGMVDPLYCAYGRAINARDTLYAAEHICDLKSARQLSGDLASPQFIGTQTDEQIQDACNQICSLYQDFLEAQAEACDYFQEDVQAGQPPTAIPSCVVKSTAGDYPVGAPFGCATNPQP